MKIDYLKINSRFKNLDNIRVDFDQKHLMTVIVGWNGAGKSNVVEAIMAIFRNLDLGEAPLFAYEIQYQLSDKAAPTSTSGMWVKIEANPSWGNTPSKQYRINFAKGDAHGLLSNEKWQPLPLRRVVRDKEGRSEFLPRYLFAYYSGPSDRLEDYFKKHRKDFYRRLLRNELSLLRRDTSALLCQTYS